MSTTSTFTQWATEAERVKGRPFPKTLPYNVLPPLCSLIVSNRVTPLYYLGWLMSEIDFINKFDPEHKRGYHLTNIWNASGVSEAWDKECGSLWRTTTPGWRFSKEDYVMIHVTTNVYKDDMERSQDRSLIEAAQRIFKVTGDPQWFRR